MQPSLHALLSGIIDYAGLFPPATLDMASTVRSYAEYKRGPHVWMLGRLIVPVARLGEFENVFEAAGPDESPPWRLSAIAAPACQLEALDADLELIEQFNKRHRKPGTSSCIIDTVELKAETAGGVDAALDTVPEDMHLFVEIPIGGDVRGMIAALAGSDAAAKVRTGGSTVDAFPEPGELARFLWACARADTPFKATAGLHHPFPRASATVVGAREHGFVNLFLGAILLRAERISADELAELLGESAPDNFMVSEREIKWKGRGIAVGEIASAREEFALSYGSCSFDEPIDDLQRLGLLGRDQAARQR